MDKLTPDEIPIVKDAAASNSKELLNAYIYDFLLKSGFNDSANAFFKEANVPMMKNNTRFTDKSLVLANLTLPKTNLTMETQHGFIYEWWQVFWDIFNARTERDSTVNAAQYYHTVSLKQRYENHYNDRYGLPVNVMPPNRFQPQRIPTAIPPQPNIQPNVQPNIQSNMQPNTPHESPNLSRKPTMPNIQSMPQSYPYAYPYQSYPSPQRYVDRRQPQRVMHSQSYKEQASGLIGPPTRPTRPIRSSRSTESTRSTRSTRFTNSTGSTRPTRPSRSTRSPTTWSINRTSRYTTRNSQCCRSTTTRSHIRTRLTRSSRATRSTRPNWSSGSSGSTRATGSTTSFNGCSTCLPNL